MPNDNYNYSAFEASLHEFFQDAAGVLAVNPGPDRSYVEHWAQELGVADLWRRVSEQQHE
jgi:hypothetical protein